MHCTCVLISLRYVCKFATNCDACVKTEYGRCSSPMRRLNAKKGRIQNVTHRTSHDSQMQVDAVSLPPGVSFAVCHSLVEAHKAQGAATR